MKWFQVDATSTDDPRLMELVTKLKASRQDGDPSNEVMALVVYGVLLACWCFAARQERARPGWCEYADQRPIPPMVVAETIRVDPGLFDRIMSVAAEVGHIDPKGWEGGLIRFPAMERRADTYTARKSAGYYDRGRLAVSSDVVGNVEGELADRLLDGRWAIEGIEIASVDRRVRAGASYIDIVAEGVDGRKAVIVVKRTRITRFAVAQVLRYCKEVGSGSIPVVVGYGGVQDNLRAAVKGVRLYTYDDSFNVISHAKSHVKSPLKDGEKSRKNTPVHVSVPVPGDLLGEDAPQVGALVSLWNQLRMPGPKIVGVMTSIRRQKIQRALVAMPNLADWKILVEWVNGQPWMNAPGTGDHPKWRADLDFLCRPGQASKYLERARLDQAPSKDVGRDPSRGRVGMTPGKYDHLRSDTDGERLT